MPARARKPASLADLKISAPKRLKSPRPPQAGKSLRDLYLDVPPKPRAAPRTVKMRQSYRELMIRECYAVQGCMPEAFDELCASPCMFQRQAVLTCFCIPGYYESRNFG